MTTSEGNNNLLQDSPLEEKTPLISHERYKYAVLFAGFMIRFSIGAINANFGIFYSEFLRYFEEEKSKTALVQSLMFGTMSCSGVLASKLTEKWGLRVVAMLGAILSFCNLVISVFLPSVIYLCFTIGIGVGIGFGFMYSSVVVAVASTFAKRRALATGIAAAGTGMGQIAFGPILQYLISIYGWKGAMLIISILLLFCIGFAALFPSLKTDSKCMEQNVSYYSILKDPHFVIIAISSGLCQCGKATPYVTLIDRTLVKRIADKMKASFLLSIIGISSISAKVIFGFFADLPCMNVMALYGISLTICGSATALTYFIQDFVSMAIYASVFGMTLGGLNTLIPILLVEVLGLEKLNGAYGLMRLFGIVSIIGPPITGKMYDHFGSYDPGFFLSGSMFILGGLMVALTAYMAQIQKVISKIIK